MKKTAKPRSRRKWTPAEKVNLVKSHAKKKKASPLLKARITKGLPQGAIAKKLGVTAGNYCRIEKGTQTVTPETATKISEILSLKQAEAFKKSSVPNRFLAK